ncbi:MAG: transglycosylase SLT domain-containing protein [Gemmatimonadota bacterium]
MRLRTPTIALLLIVCAAQSHAQTDSASRPVVIPSGAPMPAKRPDSVATPGELSKNIAAVFGESLSVAPPIDSAVEPTWDMDVRSYETQDRVAHYLNIFSGRARERFTLQLDRGSAYEPMIRARLRAGGVPEDMYYLALIESGFDPHAYSRAAAVGMWQFMTSTAKDMGMRVDWWVDERRDPVKSTAAAVRFIRELRDQFGSLYLAAAAYNGGPGRVARGMTRYKGALENVQGDDAFFVLAEKDYLKNETREYVPQLIAAALIAKEPARYGLELHPRAPFEYDTVRVPAGTPLAAIAKAINVSTEVISDLNPHVLRGMTPPKEEILVRVPVGGSVAFDSAFAELSASDRLATRSEETKKGDSYERLASANGITAAMLRAFNPTVRALKSGKLVAGQSLVIPTPAVADAARNVPDPAIERYGTTRSRNGVHTVRKGETLGGIARKYGTSTERLMKLNGLKKPKIIAGQSLIVSGGSKAKPKAKSPAKAKTTSKAKGKKKPAAKTPAKRR